jgi:TonB-linked SusC/RagA family outer membrane protein
MQKFANSCSFFQRKKLKSVLLKMKLTAILILIGTLAATATTYSQKTKIDLNLQSKVSLNEIFREIEKNSEFIFIYDAKSINTETKKSIVADSELIEPILDRLLDGSGINYRIYDRQIVLYRNDKPGSLNPPAFKIETNDLQQTRVVTGTVKDSKGEAVIGATVMVKGTTSGTSTNIEGKFQLNVPLNNQILLISFIGFTPLEVDVTGKTNLDLVLHSLTTQLEEVVVVGYGTQKKVTVTGAVTSVSNAVLIKAPVGQLSSTLQGRTPGLITKQITGEPGEDATQIQIRGVGTFAGSADPLIIVDGVEAQTYNNLDPNVIESVAVLKDASATAVYGVRGANGVLIITTKRGKVGKPELSFSSNVAMNQWIEFRKYMDGYEYAYNWNESLKYDSYVSGAYTPKFTDADIKLWKDGTDPIFHPNVDIRDMMLKDLSWQTQNNLNVRGGTDKVKYFISAGVFTQGGMMKNTDLNKGFFDYQLTYQRYNFRSNFDFVITKRLTGSFNIASEIEERNGLNDGQGDLSGWIRSHSLTCPISNPLIVGDKVIYLQAPWNGTANAVNALYGNNYAKRYKNYVNGLFRLNYDLGFVTKGLSAHGTVSYQNYNLHTQNFYKPFLTYTAIKPANYNVNDPSTFTPIIVPNMQSGPFGESTEVGKNRLTYAEFGLDYTRTFGNHTFSGLLLYNQQKKYDPNLQYLIPSGYQGLVGRIAYDYKGRYLLEFNGGYNGTENFAPGNRFGFFPAVSAGWVLSDESFFPKNNVITFVKFRGSYGQVGNDKIGGNRFLYNPSSFTNYGSNLAPYYYAYYWGIVGISTTGYGGSREGVVGNPDVTWERAKKTDIGIELKFLKNKITVSADYFYERRDNILTTRRTVPENTGATPILPVVNLGKMENSGVDGEAAITLSSGKFNYWIRGNFTYAHNTILFQDEVFNPYPYQYRTGQSFGQFFGPVEYGFYNGWSEVNDAYRPKNVNNNNRLQPGDPNFKDINGDGVFDQYDTGPINYGRTPEVIYGISLGGDYKGFDFSFLFQGASRVGFDGAGNYVSRYNSTVNNAKYLLDSWSAEKFQNGEKIAFMRNFITGGPSSLAILNGTNYTKDASYIRFKNAEIAYTFSKSNHPGLSAFNSLRIYFNVSNVFTWAPKFYYYYKGVDPEMTSDFKYSGNNEPYPKTRTYNLGVNINF